MIQRFCKGSQVKSGILNKETYIFVCCVHYDSYPENKALIEKGAIPIDDTWDGDLPSLLYRHEYRKDTFEQISMFE